MGRRDKLDGDGVAVAKHELQLIGANSAAQPKAEVERASRDVGHLKACEREFARRGSGAQNTAADRHARRCNNFNQLSAGGNVLPLSALSDDLNVFQSNRRCDAVHYVRGN